MKIPFSRLRRSVAGNLRAQLILTTVVPVAVLLVALIAVATFALTQLTQSLVQDRDTELVQLAARQVAGEWDMSVYLLSQVAAAEAVRRGNLAESVALLEENYALQQRFDQLAVTDNSGVVQVTYGGLPGESVGTRDFYDRARRLRRPVRSPIYESAQGRRVIAVAVPYYGPDGRFSGCVLGIWDLHGDTLGEPIRSIRVGENGYAFLVNSEGTILYHPEGDLIAAGWAAHPSVEAVAGGQTGAQAVRWRSRRTIIAYTPLTFTQLSSSLVADESWEGWGLLTSQLWDDIIEPLQPYLILSGVLLALALALPLVFLAINSRRIVAPLQSLVAQAEQVASGDFGSQVSINSGPTEVRELEEAFNSMVRQLAKYRSDIQDYIVSILSSQEQERKRIARELHDDTAQALVVLGRRLETAGDAQSRGELLQELNDLRDMVDDALKAVRSFTRDLRPPLLEELGLPRSLQLLGDRIQRQESLDVAVSIQGEVRQLLPEVELGLYRLAQEGLNNVRRHAHAQHATLDLTYGGSALVLRIGDDGIGFDAPEDPSELVHSGRLGLMGIYERARLFGGRAEIQSGVGQGTVVTISIPVTPMLLEPSEQERARVGRNA